MCKLFEDQNARENENENFCFIYQDHYKFYQNVQEIRKEHFTNFWYRNFAQGDVHISFGGKI